MFWISTILQPFTVYADDTPYYFEEIRYTDLGAQVFNLVTEIIRSRIHVE